MVLIWGMWLSYKIRNAPPAYNESKIISWAVYNAMFVTSFFMVFRLVFMALSPITLGVDGLNYEATHRAI